MLRKTIQEYFSLVNPETVSDNTNFWQTCKPHFSEKGNFSKKIMISEKYSIALDDRRQSETFDKHFINITKTLDLNPSIVSTFLLLQVFPKSLKLSRSS